VKQLAEFIISKETMVILNRYDDYGKLCSIVVEEEEVFEVNQSPLAIIKKSIEYYGGSLDGAVHGAKEALGRISMPPVMICGVQGLYWFPSKSFAREDCIWFSVEHIKHYETLADKTLKVHFHNGYSVTLDCTFSRFDKKVNRAHKLKSIMEKRTAGKRLYIRLSAKPANIIRDPARNHYRIHIKRTIE
jgi:competence protein ComK